VAASKATYGLALYESSAVGIAAGYAMITGKPVVVSLHTYPPLAHGMFNMRSALMSGASLLVVNGQQDSRVRIHIPVLGAPNTRLAETTPKYAYEVSRAGDIAVALRCGANIHAERVCAAARQDHSAHCFHWQSGSRLVGLGPKWRD
jgi:benzoylformate decarboxylase